ncbi:MAG: response regulator [Desulfovibrio sp.]|uniref:response regulator n=1 Tax=Desulfovibrio sp. 7SRBS1 TaxID=3378064 RepID=UPI003B3F8A27
MKILLVDDESEFVATMAERLEMRGIDADWAASGEDALEKAQTGCFDVAVLDMKMPRIGGLDLRRRLSSICPEMKFIFLSGHGSENDFRIGSAEAEYYLIKPVQIGELIEKIHLAVGASSRPGESS